MLWFHRDLDAEAQTGLMCLTFKEHTKAIQSFNGDNRDLKSVKRSIYA